jgi:hypothetical protein
MVCWQSAELCHFKASVVPEEGKQDITSEMLRHYKICLQEEYITVKYKWNNIGNV